MAVLAKIKSNPSAADYFKEILFYNRHIKIPKIKRLKNVDWLSKLPLYKELKIIETNHVFREYAKRFKVKIIERKDPMN